MEPNVAESERLQKFLARAGVASRRASEQLITAGRVRVNGKVITELGFKVDPVGDAVEFDGERINVDVRHVYMLVNKPPQMISAASDPEGRRVVTHLVPREYGRLYPVGRLDWDSEGAILLTNDGELANLLTHPRHEVPKTYMVKIKGLWADNDPKIVKLRDGIALDDGHVTAPAQIIRDEDTGKHTWFLVSISEGRNRQIRRMFEAVHIDVLRLKRIAYGSVTLGDVPPEAYRRLSEEEIEELYNAAGGKRGEFSASRGRLTKSTREATVRRSHAAKREPKRLFRSIGVDNNPTGEPRAKRKDRPGGLFAPQKDIGRDDGHTSGPSDRSSSDRGPGSKRNADDRGGRKGSGKPGKGDARNSDRAGKGASDRPGRGDDRSAKGGGRNSDRPGKGGGRSGRASTRQNAGSKPSGSKSGGKSGANRGGGASRGGSGKGGPKGGGRSGGGR